jgi:hypothetical protein
MKVNNMKGNSGRAIPNQYIIYTSNATYFQSYDSIIVKVIFEDDKRVIILDDYYWDYSRTTSKYRNQFLGTTTKEVEEKIANGEYRLEDLQREIE